MIKCLSIHDSLFELIHVSDIISIQITMITIEKSNFIIATYDIRVAIRQFNAEHAAQVQRESRYVCNTCEAVFSRRNNRTRHLSIHTSDRIWRCEQCNRFFRRQNHLNRHLLTHQTNMKSKIIVSIRTAYVSNIDVFVSQLYLQHTAFRKLLQDFRTKYNRRFFRTACSFCDILIFFDDTKWSVFEENVEYDFYMIFRQSLHCKFDDDEQRLIVVCVSCQKHSRVMFQIKFWFDEIMSLFHRSRIFLSFLKLMTNLKRIQNVDDIRSKWIIYRIVSNKSSWFNTRIFIHVCIKISCMFSRIHERWFFISILSKIFFNRFFKFSIEIKMQ